MKALSLVVFVVFGSTIAWAETGFLDRSVTIGDEIFRYQIYVPSDYTPDRIWPVIVYLHGDGRQGNDGLRHTTTGLAEQIRQQRFRFPAIAVFPQAKSGTKWEFPEMQDLAMAELDRTVDEFRGDRTRLYLTGFSMGANGTYRSAYRWPEKFAALVTIAGRIESETNPAYFSKADIEMDHHSNAFTAASDPFSALANRIGKLPIRIYHGDADTTVPVEQSRRMNDALKKSGANVRYTEYPGVNHPGARDAAWADPDLILWLLAQHR